MTSPFLLRATSVPLVALLVVASVFVLIRGHAEPGGGFVGGLLLAAAVVLRALSHGPADARARLRVDPRTLVGAGAVIATIAACLPLAAGAPLLASLDVGHVPVLGDVGTVLLFDVGVYVLVAGTAAAILLALVEEAP